MRHVHTNSSCLSVGGSAGNFTTSGQDPLNMATHSYQHSAGNGLLASVSSSAIMDAVEIISIAAIFSRFFCPYCV